VQSHLSNGVLDKKVMPKRTQDSGFNHTDRIRNLSEKRICQSIFKSKHYKSQSLLPFELDDVKLSEIGLSGQ
jgi:hypothetical protein